jgi:hypothetical protein
MKLKKALVTQKVIAFLRQNPGATAATIWEQLRTGTLTHTKWIISKKRPDGQMGWHVNEEKIRRILSNEDEPKKAV